MGWDFIWMKFILLGDAVAQIWYQWVKKTQTKPKVLVLNYFVFMKDFLL